jgi:hypothetical protein
MFRVRRVFVSASEGKTDDAAGFSKTSSKVKASTIEGILGGVLFGMMPPVRSVALIYTQTSAIWKDQSQCSSIK